jgi:hypothetical protein
MSTKKEEAMSETITLTNPMPAFINAIHEAIVKQAFTPELGGSEVRLHPNALEITAAVQKNAVRTLGDNGDEQLVLRIKVPGLEAIGVNAVSKAVMAGLGSVEALKAHFALENKDHHPAHTAKAVEEVKEMLDALMHQYPQAFSEALKTKLASWNGFQKEGNAPLFFPYTNGAQTSGTSATHVNLNISSNQGTSPADANIAYAAQVEQNVTARAESVKNVIAERAKAKALEANAALEAEGKPAMFSPEELAELDRLQIVVSSQAYAEGGGSLQIHLGLPKKGIEKATKEADLEASRALKELDSRLVADLVRDAVLHAGEKADEVYGSLATQADIRKELETALSQTPEAKEALEKVLAHPLLEEQTSFMQLNSEDKHFKPSPTISKKAEEPDILTLRLDAPKGLTAIQLAHLVATGKPTLSAPAPAIATPAEAPAMAAATNAAAETPAPEAASATPDAVVQQPITPHGKAVANDNARGAVPGVA